MAIALGDRSLKNIRGGPAQLYIAEGGTLIPSRSFGGSLAAIIFSSPRFFQAFSFLGELLENPRIESRAERVEQIISGDYFADVQLLSRVRAQIRVVEMDNQMVNTLIARAEGRQHCDFLWVRGRSVGDYFQFLRDVPFSVNLNSEHSFERLQSLEIVVSVRVRNLKEVMGQTLLI